MRWKRGKLGIRLLLYGDRVIHGKLSRPLEAVEGCSPRGEGCELYIAGVCSQWWVVVEIAVRMVGADGMRRDPPRWLLVGETRAPITEPEDSTGSGVCPERG